MRKRRGPFEELFNLPVGSELAVVPNPGETVAVALKRLKLWASKQKGQDRAYRMRIDGDIVRVQRTPPGRNTPLSDWLLMRAGDRLLLKTKPTAGDRKKALGTADHLLGLYRSRAPDGTRRRRSGNWITGLDSQGRLIALCGVDLDGNGWDGNGDFNGPSYVGWNGEWP